MLTHHIRSGTDILGRPRLGDQATVVRKAAADLVLVQEVAGDRQAEEFADIAGPLRLALLGRVIYQLATGNKSGAIVAGEGCVTALLPLLDQRRLPMY